MTCEYATDELPDPSDVPPEDGTRVPAVSFGVPGFVVEYRNQPVVAAPWGVPEPFSVALVFAIDDALVVMTMGG